ncbi:hypothetical protein [Brevundimonas denitrificans]|uniref:hypothetical protein n=1 Tax=Brevundimonas denitrificans TaxID=1443434 RepID=UPI00223AA273|nr:hypothetical protein [Brevundimonas denitrificans]
MTAIDETWGSTSIAGGLSQGGAVLKQSTLGERIAHELSTLGLDTSKSFEAAQLVVQTGFSLLGGLVVAILAYWLIHSNQIRAARDGRKIERARLLYDLDREYFNLMATRCLVRAPGRPRAVYRADELWNLEYALTKDVIWFEKMQVRKNIRIYHSINHSRYVRIHRDWLIDTLILHHVAAWGRRIGNGGGGGHPGSPRRGRHVAQHSALGAGQPFFLHEGHVRIQRARQAYSGRSGAWTGGPGDTDGLCPCKWPLRGLRLVFHRLGFGFRWCRDRMVSFVDSRRTLRRTPPDHWPADILPLYAIIYTVVAQSIIHGQLDALDYACLIDPDPTVQARLDAEIRNTL